MKMANIFHLVALLTFIILSVGQERACCWGREMIKHNHHHQPTSTTLNTMMKMTLATCSSSTCYMDDEEDGDGTYTACPDDCQCPKPNVPLEYDADTESNNQARQTYLPYFPVPCIPKRPPCSSSTCYMDDEEDGDGTTACPDDCQCPKPDVPLDYDADTESNNQARQTYLPYFPAPCIPKIKKSKAS